MIETSDVKERGPNVRLRPREVWGHPTVSPLQQKRQWTTP